MLLELIGTLLFGALVGWLAGKLRRGRGFGILGNMLVGVIGAVVGRVLFGLVGLHATSLIGALIIATLGALVLLAIVNAMAKR